MSRMRSRGLGDGRKTYGLRVGWLLLLGLVAYAPAVPADDRWNVEVVGQIGGACRAVQVVGNCAYIGEGPNLRVIDLFNPYWPYPVPVPCGKVLLPDVVKNIFIAGGFAYAATYRSGLQVINIEDPYSPTLCGSYDTSGSAFAVYVTGGFAYVADYNGGLQIIDVTNPFAPTFCGCYYDWGVTKDVYVTGGLAYLATSGGLRILDITDPSSPTLRGTYDLANGASGVYISGNMAYLVMYDRLLTLDISEPTIPRFCGLCDGLGETLNIYVKGGLAWVAGGWGGLKVINVSDPSWPFLLRSWNISGYIDDVYVAGDLVFYCDRYTGLEIVYVGGGYGGSYYSPAPNCEDVYVTGNLAYAVGSSMLQILDIRNPSAPTLLGAYSGWLTFGFPNRVYVNDGFSYITHEDLLIVDVSNPAAPEYTGLLNTTGTASDVYVTGGLAYIANGANGLQIIDVSNASLPTLRGSCDTRDYAGGVYVTGGLAYIADGYYGGLQIINVIQPSAPYIQGTCHTPGTARDVCIAGNFAYIADDDWGLQIIDVTDPSSPSRCGSCVMPGRAVGVSVYGSLAYVSNAEYGLQIVDITNPRAPALRSTCYIPGATRNVYVNDNLAYVAAGYGGLWVLRYTGGGRYEFETDREGWSWFDWAGNLAVPAHEWKNGTLRMTETPGDQIVFGAYESPRNPAIALQPDAGRVLRGRFYLRSESPTPAQCPGFRLRAYAAHMLMYQGRWDPDFRSQDYNSLGMVYYSTLDRFHIDGREPGTLGRVYTILYTPEPTSSLSDWDMVTYFTCDLLDVDTFANDSGTLIIDQVEIDSIERPAVGTGRPESVFGTTDFSSWTTETKAIGPLYNATGLSVRAGWSGIAITVSPGNQWFEAGGYGPMGALEPGRYYRAVFDVSSTEQPGGDFGPTVRAGIMSWQWVFSADKELPGGSLRARFTSTPKPFEIWFEAPSEVPGMPGQTEPMRLRFESWLTNANTGWPFYKNVSGTVSCTRTFVESFPGQ